MVLSPKLNLEILVHEYMPIFSDLMRLWYIVVVDADVIVHLIVSTVVQIFAAVFVIVLVPS